MVDRSGIKFDKNNARHRDANLCDNCAFGSCRFGLGNSICNQIWCHCECKSMAKIKEVQF